MASTNGSKPRMCLVVLIGLPGAGKTTFCNHLQTFLTEKENVLDFGFVHVWYDQLIPIYKQKEMALAALSDKTESSSKPEIESEENFKSCRKTFVLMTEEIICQLKGNNDFSKTINENILPSCNAVKDKESILIVIDDNNYYQSMRYEYYQLARKHSVGFCEIYFKPNSIDSVLSNNQMREAEEQIPDFVIRNMDSKIEAPNPFQNAWEQFSFSINVQVMQKQNSQNLYNMETCLDVIKAALDNPVQPLPPLLPDKTEEARLKSRAICSKNVYHKADKILRYVYLNLRVLQPSQWYNISPCPLDIS